MMVDSSCKIHRMSLAIRPIQEKEPCATTTSFARVMTDDSAGFGPSTAPATVARAAVMEVVLVVVVFRDSIFFDNEAHTGRLAGAHDDGGVAVDRMALNGRTENLIGSWMGSMEHQPSASKWSQRSDLCRAVV